MTNNNIFLQFQSLNRSIFNLRKQAPVHLMAPSPAVKRKVNTSASLNTTDLDTSKISTSSNRKGKGKVPPFCPFAMKFLGNLFISCHDVTFDEISRSFSQLVSSFDLMQGLTGILGRQVPGPNHTSMSPAPTMHDLQQRPLTQSFPLQAQNRAGRACGCFLRKSCQGSVYGRSRVNQKSTPPKCCNRTKCRNSFTIEMLQG